MTSTDNATTVRDYLELVWNQGRTERAEAFLAADLVQHNPRLADGRAPLVDFIEGARRQMPELRFELRRLAAEGDLVFAHSHFVPAPDLAGLAVIDVFRLVDGVIVEHWDVNEAVPETTVGDREIV